MRWLRFTPAPRSNTPPGYQSAGNSTTSIPMLAAIFPAK
jgi:hypothetical protein